MNNKDTPVCNGCGRWISDKHSHDTCEYIKHRLVSWADSEAYKTLKEKILAKKPDYKGQFFLQPPRSTNPKDGDTKGMIYCSTLSTNYPNSLPIIQTNLTAKPKTIGLEAEDMKEEEAGAAMGSDPTTDLPAEPIRDNKIEGGQRLSYRLTTLFLDTGAGDNFISAQYAASLINYGYKPLKTKTMNDKNLERKVNKILDELPEVVIDLAEYAENLEREIDKLEKTIKDMSDRITELEVSFLELKKP
jgi:hypothetical protein